MPKPKSSHFDASEPWIRDVFCYQIPAPTDAGLGLKGPNQYTCACGLVPKVQTKTLGLKGPNQSSLEACIKKFTSH